MRTSLVLAALLLAGCGCEQTDVVAAPCTVDADCPGDRVCRADRCVGPDEDAAVPLEDGAVDYCLGSGPPIAVGDGADECSGRVAERSFRFAVCSCESIVASAEVFTDSFDSRRGAYSPPGGAGGSVGTNTDINSTARWDIGGSLWSSGPSGWSSSLPAVVGGELRLAGRLAVDTAEVGGDAYVGGGVEANALRVDGTLTVPAGQDLNVGMPNIAATSRAPVDVPPPCGCAPSDLVDIAGYVAFHANENDNATVRLSPDELGNVMSATELSLPCGRYYLDRVGTSAPLTIRAEGRVAVFVGGDLSVGDAFTVELAADAELDLFVAGNIVADDAPSLGDALAPARVRLYVGGDGTIQLGGGGTFAGNLYAPRAELVTAGDTEVFGALFVRRIAASGPLTVHYDTGVLRAGEDCEPPPQCETCGDCPSVQACVDGECGACRDTSDCCAPLVCVDGECRPELI